MNRILVVDDEPDAADLLSSLLKKDGHDTVTASSLSDGIALLERDDLDLVLTDLDLGGESGLELCSRVRDQTPEIPVIVVTAHASVDVAVGALRHGAVDFLTKPVDVDEVRHRVSRALSHLALLRQVRHLQRLADAPGCDEIVGDSAPMKKLFTLINRLGPSDASILVTGESGTGKELVARALHRRSSNPDGPFVAINCAAVPEQLLESELFGHVEGAFTDAKQGRDGLFVRADGGTVFLDEIGEMPPDMQAKLLRALQERRVTPVGGDREVAFDARIVSATNRDLEEAVEKGEFREDLFYRINVVRLPIPPLRARTADILVLAQHFVKQISERGGRDAPKIGPPVAEKLLGYDWPGNVRELENAMERVVALCTGPEIRVEDLPKKVRQYESTPLVLAGSDPGDMPTLQEVEQRYIRRVLQEVQGNKTAAADILGIGRRTLYRRLEQMDV